MVVGSWWFYGYTVKPPLVVGKPWLDHHYPSLTSNNHGSTYSCCWFTSHENQLLTTMKTIMVELPVHSGSTYSWLTISHSPFCKLS